MSQSTGATTATSFRSALRRQVPKPKAQERIQVLLPAHIHLARLGVDHAVDRRDRLLEPCMSASTIPCETGLGAEISEGASGEPVGKGGCGVRSQLLEVPARPLQPADFSAFED